MTAPSEIPLLLKGPLVRQFLAGRKTVTRRMNVDYWTKKKPGDLIWFRETSVEFDRQRFYEADADLVRDDSGERVGWWLGDRFIPGEPRPFKWQPSIHMPKAAARCWADVVSIRVERLHEITEADAEAEGVTVTDVDVGCTCEGDAPDPGPHVKECRWRSDVDPDEEPHRAALALLWDSINSKRSGAAWKHNPMVARIEFRRIER